MIMGIYHICTEFLSLYGACFMILDCKNIIIIIVILSSIFLLVLSYNCRGGLISKTEYYEIYEDILNLVSCINEDANDNSIVLHGSLGWIYNAIDDRGVLVLPKMKANDLDFFVKNNCFYSVIEKLKREMPKVNFKTLTIKNNSVIWCSCYLEKGKSKFVRIADFIKSDNEFSDDDVSLVKKQDFYLTVAKAKWMIEYEKVWINNLENKINYFNAIIKEEGNKWLALSENSDSVYLIYKSFAKYNEHLQLCRLMKRNKITNLKAELTPGVNKAKLKLDNTVRSVNMFLANQWGLYDSAQKKSAENELDSRSSCDLQTYAQIVAKAPEFNEKYVDAVNMRAACDNSSAGIEKKKEKCLKRKVFSSSSTSFCKESYANTKHSVSESKHLKYIVSDVRKQKTYTPQNELYPELTNRFSSMCIDDDSIEIADFDSHYTTSDVNPFTYSFSEKLYSREGVINDEVACMLNDLSYLHQKRSVQYMVAMVIFALYFYYDVPIGAAQEAVAMLLSHTAELLMATLRFSMNSDYNWMITWPAVYAILMTKYKRYKTKPIYALALGLLSSYSCVYTYKYVSNIMPNGDIIPCPLPDWLGEIQYIPEFTISNPVTYKPDGKYRSFHIAQKIMASNKLTCNILRDIEKNFESKVRSAYNEIIKVKTCGLIHENVLSNLCYDQHWNKRDDESQLIDLMNAESERCLDRNICISARPFIGLTRNGVFKTGYTICCMKDHGECSIPKNYNTRDSDNNINLYIDLSPFRNIKLTLYRFTTLNDYEGEWQRIVEIKDRDEVTIMSVPLEGIYMLYNEEDNKMEGIMCDTEAGDHFHLMP